MSISIPQNSPKAGYLAHREEINRAISEVMSSGWYILGEQVKRFETEFAEFLSVKHTIGVASGTDALHLALRACGIGTGDGVITISHTAVATVAAIELAGATPILVDIDPGTFNLSLADLEATIRVWKNSPSTIRLKAIVPVHLYGQPAPMPEIMELAARHELLVIEDCAQAHGAEIDGRKAGSWGHASAFSFYPTKNLGAFGDGGAVATDDDQLAEQLRILREYGWRKRYTSDVPGMNTRLDELQAAILRVRLRYLAQENQRRRDLALLYDEGLRGVANEFRLPSVVKGTTHVFHQYVIRSAKRDELQQYLRQQGILTLIHYPVPVHLQPAYAGRLPWARPLPETERAAREVLSLPMFPELPEGDVATVTAALKKFGTSADAI